MKKTMIHMSVTGKMSEQKELIHRQQCVRYYRSQ